MFTHRIKGHEDHSHNTITEARTCQTSVEAGRLTIGTCESYVEISTEDGPASAPCGAVAYFTDEGFHCRNGHMHTTAEFRRREGWDYAEDGIEAQRMAAAGIVPMEITGHAAWSI